MPKIGVAAVSLLSSQLGSGGKETLPAAIEVPGESESSDALIQSLNGSPIDSPLDAGILSDASIQSRTGFPIDVPAETGELPMRQSSSPAAIDVPPMVKISLGGVIDSLDAIDAPPMLKNGGIGVGPLDTAAGPRMRKGGLGEGVAAPLDAASSWKSKIRQSVRSKSYWRPFWAEASCPNLGISIPPIAHQSRDDHSSAVECRRVPERGASICTSPESAHHSIE